jgi:hypothetical protein
MMGAGAIALTFGRFIGLFDSQKYIPSSTNLLNNNIQAQLFSDTLSGV